MYIENMDSLTSLMSLKRHYKKDSRYVNNLYTLTYDNHDSLYLTNDFISSLQNTINNQNILEENVSFKDVKSDLSGKTSEINNRLTCGIQNFGSNSLTT